MTDQYIYAALLLHKCKKPITAENVNNVLIGGVGLESTNDTRVKLLVAALKDVDIDDVITHLTVAPVGKSEPIIGEIVKVETTLSEVKKDDEDVLGLGKLFGEK